MIVLFLGKVKQQLIAYPNSSNLSTLASQFVWSQHEVIPSNIHPLWGFPKAGQVANDEEDELYPVGGWRRHTKYRVKTGVYYFMRCIFRPKDNLSMSSEINLRLRILSTLGWQA